MNDSSEHTDRNYLKNIQGKKIKAKNCFSKFEKDREIEHNAIKDMRNHFRLKNKVTKERIKKALLETFLN